MKIIFFNLLFFISFSAISQHQFGIFGGPQITDVRYMINEQKQESSIKYGVNIGAQLKFPVENKLSFSPSIMYNLRGYDVKFSGPSYPPDLTATDNNTSFHTIELAFLLQHDFNLELNHWFFRLGPSFDFALFGKEKYHTPTSYVERNMKFGFEDYGRYLVAAIFQLGYESKSGFFTYAHYNYNFTSFNNADYGSKIYNRAAGITFGKYFNYKKIVLGTKKEK